VGLSEKLKEKILHSGHNRTDFGVISIGEKGFSALNRNFPDLMKLTMSEVSTPLNYFTVASIAEQISTVAKDFDKVTLFYNEFKSAIKYNTRQIELFPRHNLWNDLRQSSSTKSNILI